MEGKSLVEGRAGILQYETGERTLGVEGGKTRIWSGRGKTRDKVGWKKKKRYQAVKDMGG